MEEKQYKYKFSIVTAIYNVEEYIEEAILSVVNQNIGFEENVQLILVNDGSTDNSDEICQKYADMYPNNIVYIKKENGGVSSARNEGMKYIEGKYMNFLDGDDKLQKNALSVVYSFFEQVYDYIDMVTIPLYFFEGKQGGHTLNYKYKKTRQVNLLQDVDYIQLSSSSAFIKAEFKDRFQFDLNMKYAEDAELINKILLEKCTVGVLASTKYLYRSRSNGSSAVQVGVQRKEWYIDYLDTFAIPLLKYAEQKKAYIPKFIQYTIMYDLQWRFRLEDINIEVLSAEEQETFKEKLAYILSYIDDEIVLKQKNISMAHKLYILRVKHGEGFNNTIEKIYSPKNISLMYQNQYLCSPYSENVKIDLVDIEDGVLKVEGCTGKIIPNEAYEILIELNGEMYPTTILDRSINNQKSLGTIIKEVQGFKAEIPLDLTVKEQYFKVHVKIGNALIRPKMVLGKFIRICPGVDNSYFITGTHRVVHKHNSLVILRNSFKVNVGREYRFLNELRKKKQYKMIMIRLAYFLVSMFKQKEVWLLMDRVDKADDNAEHLFRYLQEHDNIAKKYFVIKEGTEDYERMKQYGEVVGFNTMKHKWLLLLADKVISSHIEENIRIPFQGNAKYLRDLVDFKFVFLQHGIIKDNLSGWLNKYNKNIDLFVTSVNKEYQAILEEDYGYDESVVKLTGIPRFDNLVNKKEKQILIMPTWRKNLVKDINQTTGIRPYSETFKESEYFNTYNKLINDEDLIEIAKEYGYKILFFPHPGVQQQLQDFDRNDYVEFVPYNTSYQKMFNEASLLITDYSSVAFDFGYLKKPVIYYQFDRDTFFTSHTYTEGYFDYETMGFGKVCVEEELLKEEIINHIKSQCIMSQEYQERVKSFYRYTDTQNCKRVYDEIKKL